MEGPGVVKVETSLYRWRERQNWMEGCCCMTIFTETQRMMFISLSDAVPRFLQNWIVIPSDSCGLVSNLHIYVYNIKWSLTSCYFFHSNFYRWICWWLWWSQWLWRWWWVVVYANLHDFGDAVSVLCWSELPCIRLLFIFLFTILAAGGYDRGGY